MNLLILIKIEGYISTVTPVNSSNSGLGRGNIHSTCDIRNETQKVRKSLPTNTSRRINEEHEINGTTTSWKKKVYQDDQQIAQTEISYRAPY